MKKADPASAQAATSIEQDMVGLVAEYLMDCRARGLSPKTLKDTYRYPLERILLPFCDREGIVDPRDLDRAALNKLAVQLQDGQASPSGRMLSAFSVHSYLNTINVFLGWAASEYAFEKVKARTPRLPSRVVDVLTRKEIAALEDAARNERDAVVVRTLAETGLRVSELLSLTADDIIERDRRHYLRIRGRSRGGGAKGDREREVPVPPATLRRLRRLARGLPGDARVFRTLKRDGRTGDYRPLTPAGLAQMLETLRELAGVEKPCNPHSFRHAAATWMIQRGMNVLLVAQILGHRSLRMIHLHYGHLTQADAYDKLVALIAQEEP